MHTNSRSACQFWHKREKVREMALIPQVPQLYTLSTPGGWNWAFFPLRAAISKIQADFQNCHIWAWSLTIGKSSRSCTYTLFLPNGSKLSLFSLYGQRFPRYRSIFKIALLGHETWPLTKGPEVAHTLSFNSQRVEVKLIFARRADVFKIWADFQNFHIWPWNLEFEDRSQSCSLYSLPTPGVEIQLIFALHAAVFEIEQF